MIPERKHPHWYILFCLQYGCLIVKLFLCETSIKVSQSHACKWTARSRADLLSYHFYALKEYVYFLINYKEWWVNHKEPECLDKHQKLWMFFELYSNCTKPLDSPQLGWKSYKIRYFSTSASHSSQEEIVQIWKRETVGEGHENKITASILLIWNSSKILFLPWVSQWLYPRLCKNFFMFSLTRVVEYSILTWVMDLDSTQVLWCDTGNRMSELVIQEPRTNS